MKCPRAQSLGLFSFQSIVTPLMGFRRCSYFWYLQAKAFSWIPINMLNCLLGTSTWMFNGCHRRSPDPHHLPIPTPLTPFHMRKWQTLFFQLLRPNMWESTLTSLSFSPNIWLSRQILTTLSSNYIRNPVTFHLLPWNASSPTIIIPHLNCSKSFLSDLPASAPAAISLFLTPCLEWPCAHRAGHVTPLLKPSMDSQLIQCQSPSMTHKVYISAPSAHPPLQPPLLVLALLQPHWSPCYSLFPKLSSPRCLNALLLHLLQVFTWTSPGWGPP